MKIYKNFSNFKSEYKYSEKNKKKVIECQYENILEYGQEEKLPCDLYIIESGDELELDDHPVKLTKASCFNFKKYIVDENSIYKIHTRDELATIFGNKKIKKIIGEREYYNSEEEILNLLPEKFQNYSEDKKFNFKEIFSPNFLNEMSEIAVKENSIIAFLTRTEENKIYCKIADFYCNLIEGEKVEQKSLPMFCTPEYEENEEWEKFTEKIYVHLIILLFLLNENKIPQNFLPIFNFSVGKIEKMLKLIGCFLSEKNYFLNIK